MASIRHFTDQQFSDGTTIDGNRLEKGILDLEDYMSSVPEKDFKKRWLQTQMVIRYLPFTTSAIAGLTADLGAPATNDIPWFDTRNSFGVNVRASNVYRFKGYHLPYNVLGSAGLQTAWSTAFSVGSSPIIISAIDLSIMTYNAEYTNTFLYDSSALPANKISGTFVDNIDLQLSMDNPFIRNIQVANSILWHKRSFSAENARMSGSSPGPALIPSDMSPTIASIAGMGTAGIDRSLLISERDLNIPVPPVSRLRFSVILPNAAANNFPWGASPGNTIVPTITLTLLERLESD